MKNFFKKKMSNQENDKTHEEEIKDQHGNGGSDMGESSTESDSKENPAKDELKELHDKCNEINDKYLRLYSEFDNFRKRTAKEKIDLVSSAGAEILSSLLPVVDDFERAIKSNEKAEDLDAVKEGINLIYQKLHSILSKKGLEAMKAVGETFDPELHEAITNIPAPSEDMSGIVVDEVEKGYLLNGKVIRYAKVVVGN
jgi:molecular chaperone GrpE